ncbi:MAG: Hpt domain-containing protein [Planctomycetaceae bacterium]|nr:Hpt domain-containing protein [Planctomycetaceae bacterium]
MRLQPRFQGNDGPLTPPSEFEVVERPLVNLEAVRDRVGHDERLLRMLARFFVADAPGLCQQLHLLAVARRPNELQQVAHQLKGLAANLDAHLVASVAQQLERLNAALQWNHIGHLVDELTENTDNVIHVLHQTVLATE